MKNPCLSCERLHLDKNSPVCLDCRERLAYVGSIGRMTHSMPDALMDMRLHVGTTPVCPTQPDPPPAPTKKEVVMENSRTCKNENCRSQGRPLPVADFYKSKNHADGLDPWCKTCRLDYQKKKKAERRMYQREASKEADAARTIELNKKKVCNKCGETKRLLDFYKKSGAGDGRENVCKRCRNLRQREVKAMRPAVKKEPKISYTDAMDVLFAEHPGLLEKLKAMAEAEYRTPRAQLFFLVEQSTRGVWASGSGKSGFVIREASV